jgi:branched-chain amino acid transport system permease protein
MKGPLLIAAVVAALASVPLFVQSNVVFNFLVVTLLIALAGQGWNIVGGYGGQYSFGHAAFFGTGAYVTAILQMRYGVNAWIGFVAGIAAGAAVGAIIGGLVFRAGCAAPTSLWSRSPSPKCCASSPASRQSPGLASAF